jgi:hypothetical protein
MDKIREMVRAKFREIRWFQDDWPIWTIAALQINATNANRKQKWKRANQAQEHQEDERVEASRLPDSIRCKFVDTQISSLILLFSFS